MSIQGPPENKSMPGARPGKAPRRDDEADAEIVPPSPLGNVPIVPGSPRTIIIPSPVRPGPVVIATFPLTGNIKR